MKLLLGDCLEKLKELEDNSVDSIVTDPPYGLEFMGKEWDSFKTGRIAKYKEGGSLDVDAIQSRSGKGGAGPSYTKRAAKRCRNCGKQEWSGSPCKCDNPDFEIDNSTQLTFQQFNEEWARECYRVLKPGGHLLAFAGSRMYHRLAVGVEDAGFEIRDQIMWIYGSGFPKSHDVGKNIEKIKVGGKANLTQVGTKPGLVATNHNDKAKTSNPSGFSYRTNQKGYSDVATDRTQVNGEIPVYEITNEYKGWGTALKPAHEPIVMARKPFKGNVANNVLEWGVGGINIDGCRIGNEEITINGGGKKWRNNGEYTENVEPINETREGRFPANIIFDEEAGKLLDQQSGNSKSSPNKWEGDNDSAIYGKYEKGIRQSTFSDTGGASRFFYCPKASKSDRDEGVKYEGQTLKGRDEGQDATSNPFKLRPAIGATYAGNQTTSKIGANPNKPTQPRANIHPTVKPTELMGYLIRLVTPKGGIVLDPFMGSGSTGKAAVLEGMDFIGIEREEEYYEIAKQRIEFETNKRKFW